MRHPLIIFGTLFAVLGTLALAFTATKLNSLNDDMAQIDRDIDANLSDNVPGYKLVRDGDSIWLERSERGRGVTITQRTRYFHDSTAEKKRGRIETDLLFWEPLRWVGAAPLALGLVMIGAGCFKARRAQTGHATGREFPPQTN